MPRPGTLCRLRRRLLHSIIDVVVNGLVRRCESAIREVCRPTTQKAVQSSLHFRPGALVTRRQQVTDFRLDPLHALPGWSCAKIPTTTLRKMAWSQRVAKKIEAFSPSIFHRGFRPVERQPECHHHCSCPRRRLLRMTAAENDEVIGIGNDMRMECFTASAQTPMLQESVHVDDGKQWTGDTTLRRAALAALQ